MKTLFACAVALALFCPFDVPPGDTGWVVFVSTARDEAAQRLQRDALLRTCVVALIHRLIRNRRFAHWRRGTGG